MIFLVIKITLIVLGLPCMPFIDVLFFFWREICFLVCFHLGKKKKLSKNSVYFITLARSLKITAYFFAIE